MSQNAGVSVRDPNTNLSSRMLTKDPENGQLRCHSFAGARGRAEQYVVVGVVDRVEDLRLHRVEVREPVQLFILSLL